MKSREVCPEAPGGGEGFSPEDCPERQRGWGQGSRGLAALLGWERRNDGKGVFEARREPRSEGQGSSSEAWLERQERASEAE